MAKALAALIGMVSDQAVDRGCAAVTGEAVTSPAAADMPTLVAAHHAAVYRYARRLTRCPAEAEDLTQQTFLIAQQKLGQLRESARAGGWLLAITRNCFLKARRRQQPAPADAIGVEIDQVPDRGLTRDCIDCEALEHALAELPDDFRLVLLMFYFEELSYQEMADQLELPLGTVMSRLSRAKGHLRAKLTSPAIGPTKPPTRRPFTGATKPIPAEAAR